MIAGALEDGTGNEITFFSSRLRSKPLGAVFQLCTTRLLWLRARRDSGLALIALSQFLSLALQTAGGLDHLNFS